LRDSDCGLRIEETVTIDESAAVVSRQRFTNPQSAI